MEQKHLLILIGLGFLAAIAWWTFPERIQPEPALFEATPTPSSSVSLSPSPSSTPSPSPNATQAPPKTPVRTPIRTRTPTPAPPTRTPTPIPSPSPTLPPPTVSCTGSFAQEFLCLLNDHRRANGRGALSYDARLNQAALGHSQWMQSSGQLSHIGENGSTFAQRCAAAGTSCWAENIAKGFTSASHLFLLWRNSAPHNVNMLGPYTAIGLGTAGPYATTVFR